MSRYAAIALAALGCAAPATDARPAAIVGGEASDLESAVLLSGDQGPCSGVLIAPRVVATAGHCAAGLRTAAFGAAAPWREEVAIVDVRRARAPTPGRLDDDLALARLARAATVAPASRRTTSVDGVAALTAVGYGRTEADVPTSAGVRHAARLGLADRADALIRTDGAGPGFTCAGDSGGPALDDDGAVAAVIVAGDPDCAAASTLLELAAHRPWIDAVVAAWDGPCAADGTCGTGCATIDPDCDRCGLDGTCADGCAAPDLDCPWGGVAGATCGDDGDCESRRCVAAPDDPATRFCSAACADDGASCPAPLTACAAGTCVYAGPTPGGFGAACRADDDCRSGVCDRAVGACTRPCAEGCPDGYACGGAEAVCRRDDGGCATGGGGGLGLVALLAWLSGRRASAARSRRPARR